MKKDIAEKWVKALRSGKYKQGKSVLCKVEGKTAKYCCLGVLCHILETPYTKDGNCKCYGEGLYNKIELPSFLMKETEIRTTSGRLSEEEDTLSELNDAGKSFKEIADIIEENWVRL